MHICFVCVCEFYFCLSFFRFFSFEQFSLNFITHVFKLQRLAYTIVRSPFRSWLPSPSPPHSHSSALSHIPVIRTLILRFSLHRSLFTYFCFVFALFFFLSLSFVSYSFVRCFYFCQWNVIQCDGSMWSSTHTQSEPKTHTVCLLQLIVSCSYKFVGWIVVNCYSSLLYLHIFIYICTLEWCATFLERFLFWSNFRIEKIISAKNIW